MGDPDIAGHNVGTLVLIGIGFCSCNHSPRRCAQQKMIVNKARSFSIRSNPVRWVASKSNPWLFKVLNKVSISQRRWRSTGKRGSVSDERSATTPAKARPCDTASSHCGSPGTARSARRDGRRTNAGRRRPWPSPNFSHPISDGPHFGLREQWRRSGFSELKLGATFAVAHSR